MRIFCLFSLLFSFTVLAKLTDSEIREIMIKNSIASYPGNCPCPYSLMKNGRRCGGRSAYSRPGGHSPICYKKDITEKMIEEYRITYKASSES